MGDYGYGGYGDYTNSNDNGDYNSGGFMEQQPIQQSDTISPAKKGVRLTTITPVSCKILLEDAKIENDSFILGDTLIEKVKLVGTVTSMERKEVQTTYQVDDGTGVIRVNMWHNQGMNSNDTVSINDSVRIVGQIKVFHNKRDINAFCVRKVENEAEISHHQLSTIVADVSRKHKLVNAFDPVKGKEEAIPIGSFSAVDGKEGLNQLQRELTGIFIDEQDPELGMSIQEVCFRICSDGEVTEAAVRQAIQELSSQGIIYQTIDSEHYRYVTT